MAGGSVPPNLAPIFRAAGARYGIPPAILAGIASVESNFGANAATSSAGAVGLMQFLPSTAQSIGINPYNARQAIFGAAHLLDNFGYQQNAMRAIGAYNGGPGNPQYSYAQLVMSEAHRVGGQLGGGTTTGTPGAPGGIGGQTTTLPGVTLPPAITMNKQAYQQAETRYLLGNLQKQSASLFPSVPGEIKTPNPLLATGLLTTSQPDPSRYLQAAQNTLQAIAGPTVSLATHPGSVPGYKGGSGSGYVNPLSGFTLSRTDQGVDANAAPGTAIRALGDSKLVQVVPNWYNGQPLLLFQLLNGPKAGSYWYVAEQISPSSTQVGHVFHAGDTVARYATSGTGIEAGWGSPATPHMTLATAPGHGGYVEGSPTPEGANFRNYIGSLR